MRPEEARQEIPRPEERRLRMAPEVMGGEPGAIEEDRRLAEAWSEGGGGGAT